MNDVESQLLSTRLRLCTLNELHEKSGKTDPDLAENLARTSIQVGCLMQELGNFSNANPFFQQALEVLNSAPAKSSEALVQGWYFLGKNYYEQEEFDLAEAAYRHCLDLYEIESLPADAFLATIYDGMAYLYHDRDKYSVAEPMLKKSLELRQSLLAPDDPALAESMNHLGWLYNEHGHFDLAEELFLLALEIWRKTLGEHHASTAMGLENYADLLSRTGRVAEARTIMASVEQIRSRY